MKKVSYESDYVVADGDVKLEVTIGEGQFGSSLITVGGKIFEQEHDFSEVLGKGSDLAGKVAKVFSIVTDTNTHTNRTSVSYRLTGGPSPLAHTLSFTVENEKDSVEYEAVFTLVKA